MKTSENIEAIEQKWEEGYESGNLDAGDLFGQLLEIAFWLDSRNRELESGFKRSIERKERYCKMLTALENLENDNNSIPGHAWKLVQEAIKTAKSK